MSAHQPANVSKKARMLYYDDARHAYLYTVEPPPNLLDIYRPVDLVANTMVDVFVYGYGIGRTMSFDTRVGEIWFKNQTHHVANWRARESVLSLIRQGLDPLTLLVDRAHHHGMQFYSSLRLSANNLPDGPAGRLDLSDPAARQERFALIEEGMTRYDIDGFELDCAYEPNSEPLFKPDNVKPGFAILTQFVRDVREMARRIGQQRGRPITVGTRVLPTLSGNLKVGVDVPGWLQEGLVDFIVPLFYIDENMDQGLPFEELAELAHARNCYVYPGVRPFYRKDRDQRSASPAMYRAAAVNYLRKGADALYMMQLNWPWGNLGDEERLLLTYIGDPELMHRKNRHYFVTPRIEQAPKWDYTSPLPMELSVVGDGAGQQFSMYVGDDLAKARSEGLLRSTTLRLHIDNVSASDQIEVKLNGQTLPNDRRVFQPIGYVYAWIEYPLWDILPEPGPNTIEVAVRSRPPELGGPITLAEAELLVDLIQNRNRTPFDLPWRYMAGSAAHEDF